MELNHVEKTKMLWEDIRNAKNKGCNLCGEIKPITEFYENKSAKSGISSVCKTCVKKRTAEWHKNNREKSAAHSKKYHAKNADACNARRRNWYHENKEQRNESIKKWQSKNRDKLNKYSAEWAKRNPEKNSFYSGEYRAAKKNAMPRWADRQIIKDFYLEAKYHGLVVDHIIPLKNDIVCGLHVEHNLQLLTYHENSVKSNSFFQE